MKRIITISFVLFVAIAANAQNWQKGANGVEFIQHSHNHSAKQPVAGDVITINMSMANENDSVFSNTQMMHARTCDVSKPHTCAFKHKILVSAPSFYGDPMAAITQMHMGDSMTVRIPADSLFKGAQSPVPPFIKAGSNLLLHIRLINVQTQAEATDEDNKLRADLAKVNKEKESKDIAAYLAKNNITAQPTASGLIYVETQKGKGDFPKTGQEITVNYTGMFLDGKVFDSSVGKQPFKFNIGQGMVIKGWDEGLMLMQPGGKAKLIIPSDLGYGAMGMPPVIPASAPLVFEVELISIN